MNIEKIAKLFSNAPQVMELVHHIKRVNRFQTWLEKEVDKELPNKDYRFTSERQSYLKEAFEKFNQFTE